MRAVLWFLALVLVSYTGSYYICVLLQDMGHTWVPILLSVIAWGTLVGVAWLMLEGKKQ